VAEYTLGSARGQIRIEYDGNGVRRARDDMGRFIRETDRGGITVRNFGEKLILMGSAAVATGPLLMSVASAAVAAGAAFATAGAALGVFALAAQGQIKQIKEQQEGADTLAKAEIDAANKTALAKRLTASGHKYAEKATKSAESAQLKLLQAEKAYQTQTAGLPKATRETALAFARLKIDFENWSNALAPTTMPVFTRGINLIRQILPLLTPLVQTAATSINALMDDMEAGVSSGGFARFIQNVNLSAQTTLPNLIATIKNVVNGIRGLFKAVGQSTTDVTGSMEEVTAKFAEWGQALPTDPGFAKFMDQMQQGGGETMQVLGDLILIIKNLVIAFGPFAGATLIIVQAMAAFVEAIPVPVLRVLIGLIISVNVALRIYGAIMTIMEVKTKLWAIAQRLLNLAFLTNPIFLIVAGIVVLIGIIVLIATKTTWFQTIWEKVWGFIKWAASAAWDFIKAVVQKGFNFLKFIFLNFTGPGLIIKHWNTIKNAISNAVSFVIDFVKNNWKKILIFLTGPLGWAVAFIVKNWDKIKNVFSGAIRGVVNMVKGLGTSIANGFRNVQNALVNLRNRIFGIFSGAHKWLINAGKNIISGLIDGIYRMFRKLQNVLGSVTNVIPDWKGPAERDRKLLQPTGQMILGGLITGIQKELPELQKMLGAIGPKTIVGSVVASGGVQANGAAAALAGSALSVDRGAQTLTVDYGRLAAALTAAMDRQGIGAVTLDGAVISQSVSRIQGRNTVNQRRTR
jgi:phage-related protein